MYSFYEKKKTDKYGENFRIAVDDKDVNYVLNTFSYFGIDDSRPHQCIGDFVVKNW